MRIYSPWEHKPMFSDARAQFTLPEKQSITSGANSTSPPSSCPSAQFLRAISRAMMGRVVLKRPASHMPQLQATPAGLSARLPIVWQIGQVPLSRKLALVSNLKSAPLESVSPAKSYFGQGHDLLGQVTEPGMGIKPFQPNAGQSEGQHSPQNSLLGWPQSLTSFSVHSFSPSFHRG